MTTAEYVPAGTGVYPLLVLLHVPRQVRKWQIFRDPILTAVWSLSHDQQTQVFGCPHVTASIGYTAHGQQGKCCSCVYRLLLVPWNEDLLLWPTYTFDHCKPTQFALEYFRGN
jgi:hypothetical protein